MTCTEGCAFKVLDKVMSVYVRYVEFSVLKICIHAQQRLDQLTLF